MGDLGIGESQAEDVFISGVVLGSNAITSSWDSVIKEEGRRSPNFAFSGALFTTSGLTANMIIPAVGSKILLKSFSISTDVANFIAVKFSGQTTIPVSQFFLPASGTVIQNMIRAEPSGGADMPL